MSLARLFALFAALCSPPAAFAGQTCVSASVPLTNTNWTQSVSIPRFNPSLGNLTAVSIQLGAHIEGSAGIESFDSQASTYLIHFSSVVTARRPDASVIAIGVPVQEFSVMLSAYDGTLDFGGTSGGTFTLLSADALPSFVTLTSPADLALFTGPSAGPGFVALGSSANGASYASGPGGPVILFTSKASAIVTVCYDYTPAVISSYCQGMDTTCPCANGGFAGQGCLHSGTTGSVLSATGVASVSADSFVLHATSMPSGTFVLFFQGTLRLLGGSGTAFGDGLLCAGGNMTRLGIKSASGTSAHYPASGDIAISITGGVQAGSVRTYQGWYRDGAAFCTSSTFNLTQGLEAVWVQ